MKFGKNLAHLSIPEWKVYNLDYNDLKAAIRDATNSSATDLSILYHKFTDNFDYLNLFVITKVGELARILHAARLEFDVVRTSKTDSSVERLSRLSSLHYDVINNVSIELRKLTKFILVQKLAVKKIFKKFAKHYPDKSLSKPMISTLTHVLQSNKKSFVNMDLSHLTSELLALLRDIERELRLLHDLILRRPLSAITPYSHLKSSHSVSTIKTVNSSVFSEGTSPEDVNLDTNFDLTIDHAGKFDLITMLKKNFALHSVVPQDVAARNDLHLAIDVYLNIPKLSDPQRVSMICLTKDTEDSDPSWIISYEHSSVSVVMAHTGGLRKYSYCCIPNTMVENILAYLTSDDEEERSDLAQKVEQYLEDERLPLMTKLTLNCLLSGDLQPSLQLVCDRTRYFLHKDSTQHEDQSYRDDDELSNSPLTMAGPPSTVPSTVDKKVYEDSFYMTFDEKIFTTNDVPTRINFDPSNMDPFPFNRFSIFSNDSNLHNFEGSLQTTLDDKVLRNTYKAIALKRLPVKIQSFLKNTSVYLFKGFSLVDYMRSCYFNVIPNEPNNHYSRLLNINLFKNYENVEIVNNQNDVDESIIQDRARTILKRQMSCKSLQAGDFAHMGQSKPSEEREAQSEYGELRKSSLLVDVAQYNPYDLNSVVGEGAERYFQKLNNLENFEEEEEEEDSYFVYLQFNNDLEDNMLNSSILSFIKIKHRVRRAFRAFNLLDSGVPLWRALREKYGHEHEHESVLNYDSINEDATFFNTVNDYQLQLIHDYDHVLSILYFSLCFSALFISGINLGIVFSLLNLQNENTNFSVLDNPLVSVLLIFGYLFALVFILTSINLNFQRFRPSPASHSGIVWAGFTMVLVTIGWTLIEILP